VLALLNIQNKSALSPRAHANSSLLLMDWYGRCTSLLWRAQGMKRFIATVICLVALASAAIPVDAQTRSRRLAQQRYSQRYNDRYQDRVYNDRVYRDNSYVYGLDNSYVYGDDRSVWEKHRDKITTAGGAVAGAVIGGLAGGKKGAIIGAIAGGGGAAVYTYKIRERD
jgi:hypothetical protein